MNQNICVPISTEIVYEMLLRRGLQQDISYWIERIVLDYLERTKNYDDWNDEYYDYLERKTGESDFKDKYGDATKGYRWKEIDLPNGSQLCMEYKRKKHYAFVKFEKIVYEGESFSPAELARKIADGTTRNAWRDIYIKRPGEKEWKLADVLRKEASR